MACSTWILTRTPSLRELGRRLGWAACSQGGVGWVVCVLLAWSCSACGRSLKMKMESMARKEIGYCSFEARE